MSDKIGKERGKLEKVYTALYYTFYVAVSGSGGGGCNSFPAVFALIALITLRKSRS